MTRSHPLLLLLLAASLALAGCLGGGGSEADSASTDGGTDPGSSAEAGAQDGSDGDDPTTRPNATLEEPPTWRAGDWWTVTLEDPFTGRSETVTQVVASQHGSTYDVGLAKEDFADSVVVYHWPPLGEVSGEDLSFSVHNEDFKPLAFPLEEGRSWETTYFQTTYQGEVVETSGTTAEVSLSDGDGSYINMTYDAEARTITSMTGPLGLEMEVTDSGTGHEGDVVVPHGRTQYFDGRLVGALDLGFEPAPPSGTLDVGEPEASVALIAGSITVDGQGAPGIYRETATTPGGTTHQLQTTGTEGLVYQYGHADDAQGTWEFEHVAAGAGAAATEIIAYEKLTVTLPAEPTATSG